MALVINGRYWPSFLATMVLELSRVRAASRITLGYLIVQPPESKRAQ
jgi:hypothetical protein